MPHLTLEYTRNVDQPIRASSLFTKLHCVLVDAAGIRIENCKSRLRRLDEYHIAEGQSENAFVHLDIRFLEGRSLQIKQEVGRRSLMVLGDYFAPSMTKCALQLTVAVNDIERQTYFKLPEGTLNPIEK